jgi:hypothetical protein
MHNHVDRLQQGKNGLVIILKGANAAEQIPVWKEVSLRQLAAHPNTSPCLCAS